MKILFVTIFPPEIGGPSTQAAHLCEALKARGHTPVVVAFDRRATFTDSHAGMRVHRILLPPSGKRTRSEGVLAYLRFARRLDRILAFERPDVVHCNSMGGYALIVGTLARLRGIPTVVKFASDLVWESLNRRGLTTGTIEESHRAGLKARALSFYERITLRSFSRVWAASEYRRKTLIGLLGVRPDRIRVVPNYVRLPEPLAGDPAENEGVSLLAGGRFVPHKRFQDLVSALALLRDESVDLHLYGGGNPPLEERVLKRAAELGVADRVHHHGKVSDAELLALHRAADIYVSTSVEEGFAISVVEAMALGLPVIAVRKGAIPEVLPEGRAGLLFEPGDVQGLADAIRRLARDPDLRARYAAFGSDHARQYDLDRGVDEFTRLYEELVGASA